MRRQCTTWDENAGLLSIALVTCLFSVEVEPIFIAVGRRHEEWAKPRNRI